MAPRYNPAAAREFAKQAKDWMNKWGRRISEEAATETAREEAKLALKEGAAEVAKEVAKDAITEAMNSRKKGEKEKEAISIQLTIKQDEEHRKKVPIDGEKLAEEISALKDFVASLFAEASASLTEEVHIVDLVLLGGAVALLVGVGAYILHHRCGRAAAETKTRSPVYRGGVAETSALGLHVVLQGRAKRVVASQQVPIIAAANHGAPSSLFAEKYMHKNRLQTFAERTYKKQPIYKVEFEPDSKLIQPKFRCTVEVDGQQFSSSGSFGRKKEAEQDAARVAYEILAAVGEDDIKEACRLIDQDIVFCKSILHEFAVKTNTTWPSYSVAYLIKPLILFTASVLFQGNHYTGESAPSKKDAELNAARAVIKLILAKHNSCMMEIVRSKKQLITAVRSSGSTLGGPDHEAPLLQNASSSFALQGQGGTNATPVVGTSANPSSANVGRSKSKKRKGRV